MTPRVMTRTACRSRSGYEPRVLDTNLLLEPLTTPKDAFAESESANLVVTHVGCCAQQPLLL